MDFLVNTDRVVLVANLLCCAFYGMFAVSYAEIGSRAAAVPTNPKEHYYRRCRSRPGNELDFVC